MKRPALARVGHWALVVALATAGMNATARGNDFVRGDVNQDGGIDLGDAILILSYLVEGNGSDCDDSVDANDDGNLNIGDPVYLLHAAFNPTPPPYLPPLTCGTDPTADNLDCNTFTACP